MISFSTQSRVSINHLSFFAVTSQHLLRRVLPRLVLADLRHQRVRERVDAVLDALLARSLHRLRVRRARVRRSGLGCLGCLLLHTKPHASHAVSRRHVRRALVVGRQQRGVHRLRLAAEVHQRVAQVPSGHRETPHSLRVVATEALVEVTLALRPGPRLLGGVGARLGKLAELRVMGEAKPHEAGDVLGEHVLRRGFGGGRGWNGRGGHEQVRTALHDALGEERLDAAVGLRFLLHLGRTHRTLLDFPQRVRHVLQ